MGPNPASNPGGVTPPTASNPNQPVVPPVSEPVTGVTPPTSSSEPTVTPQGITKTYCSNPCAEEEPSSLSGQAYTTSKQTSQATSGPAHHIVEMAEQVLMRAAAKYGSEAVVLANFLIHVLGDSDLDAPSKSVVLSKWAEEFDRGPGVLEPPIPVTPPAPAVPRPPVSPQPVAAPVTFLGLIGQIAGALIATLLLTGDSQRNAMPEPRRDGDCDNFSESQIAAAALSGGTIIRDLKSSNPQLKIPFNDPKQLKVSQNQNIALGYFYAAGTVGTNAPPTDFRIALSGYQNIKNKFLLHNGKNTVFKITPEVRAVSTLRAILKDYAEAKILEEFAYQKESKDPGVNRDLLGTGGIIIVSQYHPCNDPLGSAGRRYNCSMTIDEFRKRYGNEVKLCVLSFEPAPSKRQETR
jgi:hypothetical protein